MIFSSILGLILLFGQLQVQVLLGRRIGGRHHHELVDQRNRFEDYDCCDVNPCVSTKTGDEVCGEYKNSDGAYVFYLTFANKDCLYRSKCEDDDWSFYAIGKCGELRRLSKFKRRYRNLILNKKSLDRRNNSTSHLISSSISSCRRKLSKASDCCKKHSCLSSPNMNTDVCAFHETGVVSTFPDEDCLKRAICEDSKWKFCYKGECQKDRKECESSSL